LAEQGLNQWLALFRPILNSVRLSPIRDKRDGINGTIGGPSSRVVLASGWPTGVADGLRQEQPRRLDIPVRPTATGKNAHPTGEIAQQSVDRASLFASTGAGQGGAN